MAPIIRSTGGEPRTRSTRRTGQVPYTLDELRHVTSGGWAMHHITESMRVNANKAGRKGYVLKTTDGHRLNLRPIRMQEHPDVAYSVQARKSGVNSTAYYKKGGFLYAVHGPNAFVIQTKKIKFKK